MHEESTVTSSGCDGMQLTKIRDSKASASGMCSPDQCAKTSSAAMSPDTDLPDADPKSRDDQHAVSACRPSSAACKALNLLCPEDPELEQCSRSIYFARVPPTVPVEELHSIFSSCGDVVDINLYRPWATSKTSKGCGTVEYKTAEAAKKAILTLHELSIFPGAKAPLLVEQRMPAMKKPPRQPSHNNNSSTSSSCTAATQMRPAVIRAAPKKPEQNPLPQQHYHNHHHQQQQHQQQQQCQMMVLAGPEATQPLPAPALDLAAYSGPQQHHPHHLAAAAMAAASSGNPLWQMLGPNNLPLPTAAGPGLAGGGGMPGGAAAAAAGNNPYAGHHMWASPGQLPMALCPAIPGMPQFPLPPQMLPPHGAALMGCAPPPPPPPPSDPATAAAAAAAATAAMSGACGYMLGGSPFHLYLTSDAGCLVYELKGFGPGAPGLPGAPSMTTPAAAGGGPADAGATAAAAAAAAAAATSPAGNAITSARSSSGSSGSSGGSGLVLPSSPLVTTLGSSSGTEALCMSPMGQQHMAATDYTAAAGAAAAVAAAAAAAAAGSRDNMKPPPVPMPAPLPGGWMGPGAATLAAAHAAAAAAAAMNPGGAINMGGAMLPPGLVPAGPVPTGLAPLLPGVVQACMAAAMWPTPHCHAMS